MKDVNFIHMSKKREVIKISAFDHDRLSEAIKKDTAFLASQGIMDYSMYLVTEQIPTKSKLERIIAEPATRNTCLSRDSKELYHVGIIDWL